VLFRSTKFNALSLAERVVFAKQPE